MGTVLRYHESAQAAAAGAEHCHIRYRSPTTLFFPLIKDRDPTTCNLNASASRQLLLELLVAKSLRFLDSVSLYPTIHNS